MSGHTAGPYFWREYAQDAEDLKHMRSLGMTPTRMLTNEGQVPLMAGTGDDVKRIALIDCQTSHKRGQGYKTACAERDANAALFAAAPDLVKALQPFIESLPGPEHAKLIDKQYGDFNPIQATVTKAQMQFARAALATLTARKMG